jgi:hypothetical protein
MTPKVRLAAQCEFRPFIEKMVMMWAKRFYRLKILAWTKKMLRLYREARASLLYHQIVTPLCLRPHQPSILDQLFLIVKLIFVTVQALSGP